MNASISSFIEALEIEELFRGNCWLLSIGMVGSGDIEFDFGKLLIGANFLEYFPAIVFEDAITDKGLFDLCMVVIIEFSDGERKAFGAVRFGE
jgi:hypothetical protein